jgi:hypothetical protein
LSGSCLISHRSPVDFTVWPSREVVQEAVFNGLSWEGGVREIVTTEIPDPRAEITGDLYFLIPGSIDSCAVKSQIIQNKTIDTHRQNLLAFVMTNTQTSFHHQWRYQKAFN